MNSETQQEFVITTTSISSALSNYLKDREVYKFTLNFSGGSDQGYLEVSIEKDGIPEPINLWDGNLEEKEIIETITDAAWNGIPYSGAGEGQDYGDVYVFDLKKNQVHHSEWFMQIKNLKPTKTKLNEVD
mgnify:CR=1 FL=1